MMEWSPPPSRATVSHCQGQGGHTEVTILTCLCLSGRIRLMKQRQTTGRPTFGQAKLLFLLFYDLFCNDVVSLTPFSIQYRRRYRLPCVLVLHIGLLKYRACAENKVEVQTVPAGTAPGHINSRCGNRLLITRKLGHYKQTNSSKCPDRTMSLLLFL